MAVVNIAQRSRWNDVVGPDWVRRGEHLEAQNRPFGELAMDTVGVERGDRVIDVGCGGGDTTFSLAERTGPEGHVLGADISAVMLARAQARAERQAVDHVEFVVADAEVHAFAPGRHDLVFSRFGVMFFGDPLAAFANLAVATRTGGRLGFVCWGPVGANGWMAIPRAVLARHVKVPLAPVAGTPGPYGLSDPERVVKILTAGGWRDVAVQVVHTTMAAGGPGATRDEAVEILTASGVARDLLTQHPEARALVEADLGRALPADLVLPACVLVVTATRGDRVLVR